MLIKFSTECGDFDLRLANESTLDFPMLKSMISIGDASSMELRRRYREFQLKSVITVFPPKEKQHRETFWPVEEYHLQISLRPRIRSDRLL